MLTIFLLYLIIAALTKGAFSDGSNNSCSVYNGSYCGAFFGSNVTIGNATGDQEELIASYLADLRVTSFRYAISDACYDNLLAVLCYATLRFCQDSTQLHVCYTNCTDFHASVVTECPNFVRENFWMLVDGASPCESLSSQGGCVTLTSISAETTPISQSIGVDQVHSSCVPFPGPVECAGHVNSSFYYSYTTDYRDERLQILGLLDEFPNCNTSDALQYICNSAFPSCNVTSGDPVVVCEDDCRTAMTRAASCDVFNEAATLYPISLNCSHPLQYVEENYPSRASSLAKECIALNVSSPPALPQCVPIPATSDCRISLGRNTSFVQEFNGDVVNVFLSSLAAGSTSTKCKISLTFVSCYFTFTPCTISDGQPVRICPEDCIVPDAISLYACKDLYDAIRGSQTAVGAVVSNFNCSDPMSYLNSPTYAQDDCIPIVTLRSLFEEEIKEYTRIINGNDDNTPGTSSDTTDNLLYIVIGAAAGVLVLVILMVAVLMFFCCRRIRHKRSADIVMSPSPVAAYSKASSQVRMHNVAFAEGTLKETSEEPVDQDDYVNNTPTGGDAGKTVVVRQSAVEDEYDNCESSGGVYCNEGAMAKSSQQPGMGPMSMYLPPANMPSNAMITREDLERLNDGKIFSALLPKSSLVLDTVLGEGAFGKVYKGFLNQTFIRRLSMAAHSRHALVKQKTDDNVLTVAVKTIKSGIDKEECIALLKESAIMKSFDHPNVLGLVGISLNTEDLTPMIVLPFMRYGDLKTFLVTKRKETKIKHTFPEGVSYNLLIKMCSDIANGMKYLASRKFVHRDLAARNCMLDDEFTVKIADFGLTRDVFAKDYYKLSNFNSKLPVKWMAPESLHDKISDEKTDVWSFGVTIWEIFSLGRQPFPGVQNVEIVTLLEHGKRLGMPPLCQEDMYSIMRSCWIEEPDERATFSELLKGITELIQLQVEPENDIENLKRDYDPEEAAKNAKRFISSLSEATFDDDIIV